MGIVELPAPSPGWHLYVAGTETFDGEGETAEWAVAEYAWWPDNRYFQLPEAQGASHAQRLQEGVQIVKALALWRDVPVAGVAVGFDDGDFEIVFSR